MNLIISLCVVTVFVVFAGEVLRKHPLPFYLGAVVLCTLSVVLRGMGVYNFTFSGVITGALFFLVMFAGVFPPGSYGAKKFMPVRAQLSIIGGIFAIEHSLAYSGIYLTRMVSGNAKISTVIEFAVALVLLLVLLPLFVTSFKFIRKKMDGKKWKKLQRMAYVFYGLVLAHVLVINIPRAIAGKTSAKWNVFAYSFIFLSYLLCRIFRAVNKNDKTLMVRKQIISVVVSFAVAVLAVFLTGVSFEKEEQLPMVAGAVREGETDSENENTSEDGYKDGTYEGTGMGNNGKIMVSVTISEGSISDIEIVKFPDDPEYFDPDVDGTAMIEEILNGQSTDIDTISGATYSSEGLIDAINEALVAAKG